MHVYESLSIYIYKYDIGRLCVPHPFDPNFVDFPKEILCVPKVFLMFSLGCPQVLLKFSSGVPQVFNKCSLGCPQVFIMCLCGSSSGVPQIFPSCFLGVCKGCSQGFLG